MVFFSFCLSLVRLLTVHKQLSVSNGSPSILASPRLFSGLFYMKPERVLLGEFAAQPDLADFGIPDDVKASAVRTRKHVMCQSFGSH